MKTFIVTGSTQGLGLAIATELAKHKDHRVVMAVRDVTRGQKIAERIGAEAMTLDLSTLAGVRAFASAWKGEIAGLINNAGVQITDGTRMTKDGFEETIAVNHLAALELTMRLKPWLSGGRVLFIGSATHDPSAKGPRRFGFRGAQWTSIDALAHGESDATDDEQRGKDRYATSKFLNHVTSAALAMKSDWKNTRFYTLDPGMIAGTGLARTSPAMLQWVWRNVLPFVSRFMEGSSTLEQSAGAAAWLMTTNDALVNGGSYDHTRSLSKKVWERVNEDGVKRAVIEQSERLLSAHG